MEMDAAYDLLLHCADGSRPLPPKGFVDSRKRGLNHSWDGSSEAGRCREMTCTTRLLQHRQYSTTLQSVAPVETSPRWAEAPATAMGNAGNDAYMATLVTTVWSTSWRSDGGGVSDADSVQPEQ